LPDVACFQLVNDHFGRGGGDPLAGYDLVALGSPGPAKAQFSALTDRVFQWGKFSLTGVQSLQIPQAFRNDFCFAFVHKG
jgi:hypothetical protein